MLQMRDLKSFCKLAEEKMNERNIRDYRVQDIMILTDERVTFLISTPAYADPVFIEVERKDNAKEKKLEEFL